MFKGKKYIVGWRIVGTQESGVVEGKRTFKDAVSKCTLWNAIAKEDREFFPMKKNWRGVWTRVKGY